MQTTPLVFRLSIAFVGLVLASAGVAAQSTTAFVTFVKGKATFTPTGGEEDSLVNGAEVDGGGVVTTAGGSYLELTYTDGTVLRLGKSARVELGSSASVLRQGTALVTYAETKGARRALVAPPLAGSVRGTTYMMEHLPGKWVKMITLEGEFEVSGWKKWREGGLGQRHADLLKAAKAERELRTGLESGVNLRITQQAGKVSKIASKAGYQRVRTDGVGVGPGQMMVMNVHGELGNLLTVDVENLMKTSILAGTGKMFPDLPDETTRRINQTIAAQKAALLNGLLESKSPRWRDDHRDDRPPHRPPPHSCPPDRKEYHHYDAPHRDKEHSGGRSHKVRSRRR